MSDAAALLRSQVARTPDAVAVRDYAGVLTYRELDNDIERLATVLAERGAGPDVIVGLFLERTREAVVAVHAIHRAAAAYLPLDASHPPERTAFVVADAAPALVITSAANRAAAAGWGVPLLDPQERPSGASTAPSPARPDHAAYVLYTSGSTGRPKGVVVPRSALGALLAHCLSSYSPEELAVVGCGTSFGFDLSVPDLFAPLLVGGELRVLADPLAVGVPSCSAGVTFAVLVPSVATHLLRTTGLPASLQTLVLCGEPCSGELVRALWEGTGLRRLVNAYGPTETTVFVSGYDVPRDLVGEPSIGRAFDGATLTVVDDAGNEVPDGAVGELAVSGAWLARGYLGQPELTEERFPTLVGRDGRHARSYLTGDLARRRPDGDLQVLGRRDQQVKLRGHRIELGEVEALLREAPGASEAAVVVQSDGRGLLAFVVGGDPEAARERLCQMLPSAVVPAAVTALPRLPLTANGKVDRSALLAYGLKAPVSCGQELTHLERTVGEAVAAAVKLAGVPDPDADLFRDVGLDSLASIEVLVSLERALGVELQPQHLMDGSSVRALSARLAGDGIEAPRPETLLRTGSRGTLVLVGAWFGQVLAYRRLAAALPADLDVAVLALAPQQPDRGFATTMIGVADLTADLVTAHVGPGPIIIGGHSQGGAVAYEAAQILTAAHRPPALIALLDTDAPELGFRRLQREAVARLQARRRSPGQHVTQFARGARHLSQGVTGGQRAGGAAGTHDRDLPARLAAQDRANWLALRSWRPRPYPGEALLVWTAATAAESRLSDLGWRPLLGDHLDMAEVDGTHLSMLGEGHVARVASVLAARIDRALLAAPTAPRVAEEPCHRMPGTR